MRTDKESGFHNPGRLIDGDLELILIEKAAADPIKGFVPAYKFEMRIVGTKKRIGSIELRVGNTERVIRYDGHFGYGVDPEYRGCRYAARSLRLLFPLARKHEIDPVWVTCDPDNRASRRTCEIAGGRLVEVVDLPEDTDHYREGERKKCRYRFDL